MRTGWQAWTGLVGWVGLGWGGVGWIGLDWVASKLGLGQAHGCACARHFSPSLSVQRESAGAKVHPNDHRVRVPARESGTFDSFFFAFEISSKSHILRYAID